MYYKALGDLTTQQSMRHIVADKGCVILPHRNRSVIERRQRVRLDIAKDTGDAYTKAEEDAHDKENKLDPALLPETRDEDKGSAGKDVPEIPAAPRRLKAKAALVAKPESL